MWTGNKQLPTPSALKNVHESSMPNRSPLNTGAVLASCHTWFDLLAGTKKLIDSARNRDLSGHRDDLEGAFLVVLKISHHTAV